jgi:predicted DNA-binding transcriptional regulator YafY
MPINRLFDILYVLMERSTVTAKELAERLEVSQRTIYRDVELLSESGIPVYMSKGKGGGISILPEFVFNKALLTDEERQDILTSMRAVSAISLSSKGSAMQKMQNLLGQRSCDWIEVDFSSWGYFGNDASTFETIKTAILGKQALSFIYASGKSERLPRTVLPLKLLFKGSAWYLYGYCELRRDVRFFKLRRIEQLTILPRRFDMDAPEHILSSRKVDTSHYISAEVRISTSMAFRVQDEISNFTVADNGDFLCELNLPDIGALCTYISSFGEHATILSPQCAVIEMRRRLEASLMNYHPTFMSDH